METKEFSTKSRVRGDFQARFCEKGRVKFPPTYSTVVILFIFLGIAAGYVLRKRFTGACDTVQTLQGRLITYLIWLLLFLLGVEVGGNEQIIRALPTLGVEALLISVATVVGCCSLAWGLWKMTGGKR